jgi:hypothetical protein
LTAAADWRSIEWSNNSGWGLYGAGTSNNYLGGSLGFGNTALTNVRLRNSLNITGNISSYGYYTDSRIQSDVTANASYIYVAPETQAATFTLSNLYGVNVGPISLGTNSTITNAYAFYGNIAAATGRWNLYCNGSASNYMAGSLGIGITSLTGYNLAIQKNLTGAASGVFSIYQNSSVQSDVTGTANGIGSFTGISSTTALGTLRHFVAAQGTFAGGGTVTTQVGFTAASTLTSATNNYGFRGEIGAGSNRWNLYMDGTASNHVQGNLLLGSTTDGGQKLQVTGDSIIKGSSNDSSSFALTVQNNAGTNILRIRGDRRVLIGQASTSAAPVIYAFEGITGDRSLRIGIQSAGSLTPIPAFNINQENDYTYTTGTGEFTTITANFLPTSGTGTLAGLVLRNTINQTGGANGITRGLYINPTLTSAADWRAIEVSAGVSVMAASSTASASIRIPSGTAPTSPVNGDIWFDGTDLKIRIGGVTKTFTVT